MNTSYQEKYVYEIINKNFGKFATKKYKAYSKAIFRITDDTDAWFGKICRDKNGNFVVNKSCGWINKDNGKEFVMEPAKKLTKNEKYRIQNEHGRERLIFAKDKGCKEYRFYGVYKTTVDKKSLIITCKKLRNTWP